MDLEETVSESSDKDAWRRFDEAVEVLRNARQLQQAAAPGEDVLVAVEALAAPFRGSARIGVSSIGGKLVHELDFDVQRTALELHQEVASVSEVALDDLGIMLLADQILLAKDDRQVLSYGFRGGSAIRLGLLVAGIPRPDHSWDFRRASGDVCDAHSDLFARLRGGATCDQFGVVLDGQDGHVEIDPWEWSGPVTFEMKVRYHSFAHQSAVVAVGKQQGDICDLYTVMSYTMFVVRESLVKFTRVISDQTITLDEWFHLVATCEDGSTALYINGSPAGSVPEGVSARTLQRQTFLGRSLQSGGFLDGRIAYFRVWHGAALPFKTVELLYGAAQAD